MAVVSERRYHWSVANMLALTQPCQIDLAYQIDLRGSVTESSDSLTGLTDWRVSC